MSQTLHFYDSQGLIICAEASPGAYTEDYVPWCGSWLYFHDCHFAILLDIAHQGERFAPLQQGCHFTKLVLFCWFSSGFWPWCRVNYLEIICNRVLLWLSFLCLFGSLCQGIGCLVGDQCKFSERSLLSSSPNCELFTDACLNDWGASMVRNHNWESLSPQGAGSYKFFGVRGHSVGLSMPA